MAKKTSRKTSRQVRKRKGTRQSTFNKRRKGLLAVIIPWMRRFGMALAFVVGVVWVGSWLYLSGALQDAGNWSKDQFITASADAGFTVENILVEGREYTDADVLLAIINVQKGAPLFSFEPQSAQDLITQIGWVEAAQVERRWPDTIYIGLQERTPMALWQSEKRLKLLDDKGEVIVTDNLQRFSELVLVSGQGAPQEAGALIGNLRAEPNVFEKVETAQRISKRRWDLGLKNGFSIKLPEEGMGLALRRLSEAHDNDGLLDKDIVGIDMREQDRISVQTKPGSIEEYKAGLKVRANAETKAGNNI
ncbi:MAG: FtsQ-type POTRA domain-containing protein [Pseudomonadota bacterium]